MNVPPAGPLVTAAAVFVTAAILTPLVRHAGSRFMIVDKPNARSLHTAPVPRTGGLAILFSVMVGLVLVNRWLEPDLRAVFAATAALGLLGFADDIRALPILMRLMVQVLLGGLVLSSTGVNMPSQDAGVPAVLFLLLAFASLVWVVGITNIFNFMDGINGMAGLQAIITCGVLAALFAAAGDAPGAVFAGIIGAAVAGFLPWNYPSGSIFMGDSGSTSLGFMLALLVLRAADHAGFVAAALVMAPFVLDSGVTLLVRLARRQRVWSPHREHFYQRLVTQGWSHGAVAALWASMALVAALIALRLPAGNLPGTVLSVVSVLGVCALVGVWILRRSDGSESRRPAD